MSSDKVTIVLIDDHQVVREGLRAYLSTEPDIEVIGEASNGREGARLAAERVPDVALVDLVMPDPSPGPAGPMDGIMTIREIKKLSPHTQVIVLTSYAEDEKIFPAVRAGALSYLLKDVSAEDLVKAIHAAARGEATLHPQVAARLVSEVSGGDPSASLRAGVRASGVDTLTEREMEVLTLIARGMSNREIAQALVVTEKTVKSHVSNILSKLHLADRTQAAIYALRQGIVP
ncbi:MAG TPA: response regulator transcription factor [Anaerolineae bacterium]|nr:response regulator transcription factor [Anaerolineae bacterium]